MTKPALMVLKSITKSFKNGQESLQVLKGIDLSVEEGTSVAIMGPSDQENNSHEYYMPP